MNLRATSRICLLMLLLGGMTFLLPSLLRADPITLTIPPGAANPIDSFSFGVSNGLNDFSFTLPISSFTDQLNLDAVAGKPIPAMILTDTNNTITLSGDIVTSFQTVSINGVPTADVTLDYGTLTITFPGGNPTPTPEPSTLLLLGTGLGGLIVARHRKRLASRAAPG